MTNYNFIFSNDYNLFKIKVVSNKTLQFTKGIFNFRLIFLFVTWCKSRKKTLFIVRGSKIILNFIFIVKKKIIFFFVQHRALMLRFIIEV